MQLLDVTWLTKVFIVLYLLHCIVLYAGILHVLLITQALFVCFFSIVVLIDKRYVPIDDLHML